ncbi:hypothetical protein [Paenibacillus rigui]|uniref:Uncharacterized protein n=1 Tax=Paenibacillus rigui TaxID=554312 RepID=A0A229UTR7_9BACL|nr:hypothetical protein [Paenibacillus rigui]OXM86565.1 hypothetical protein CF651_08905 [Paenibacillus rigui]
MYHPVPTGKQAGKSEAAHHSTPSREQSPESSQSLAIPLAPLAADVPLTGRAALALQRTVGNQAVIQMMRGFARMPAQRAAASIQRKPVEDDKHNGFFKDDQEGKAKFKFKLVNKNEDGSKKQFQIRNQLKVVYWKQETPDTYYEDSGYASEFNIEEHLKSKQFGSWMETEREARKEHAAIDSRVGISTDEKQRLKDAISMYLLQRFISNALFRAEEIERMDYQASPLNYQKDSQYMRSFATSFVTALEETLPDKYPSSRLVLTRTEKMEGVLEQFFQVMKVNVKTDASLDGIKSQLTKTVQQSADYLLTNDADLTKYWEVPGNPQAFVDITPLMVGTVEENIELSNTLGNQIKKLFAQAVAEKMAETEVNKASSGIEESHKEAARNEVSTHLAKHIDGIERTNKLTQMESKVNNKVMKADDLIKDPGILEEMDGFHTWLNDAEEGKKFTGKLLNKFKAAYRQAPSETVSAETITANKKEAFKPLIKDPSFKAFLTGKKESIKNEIKQAGFTEPGAWALFERLKKKAGDAFSTSNMVVTTGGIVKIKEKDEKYAQPAIFTDDKAMGMAVKTAVNKSGNVPSPTEASRKLFMHEQLKDIEKGIMEAQSAKAPSADRERLGKLKEEILSFDPASYTSLAQAADQLDKTKLALEKFKEGYSREVDYISIEARAAIALLENSGALKEDSPLPKFILAQLQQHLEDALLSQSKIEDFVRNIQAMHETAIFAMEWRGAKPDEDYEFGAPQFKATESETEDRFFQGAHITDYGLKAFAQAYDAVAAQVKANGSDGLNIEAFYNIYFELSDKLRATQNTSKGGKVKLETPSSIEQYLDTERFKNINVDSPSPDMVLIDIHPNDATKQSIAANEVTELIIQLFETKKSDDSFRCSVIVDITLNHTTEEEVAKIRKAAHPYIQSGQLNLVFVQSLTKFAQLGMDKQSGGLIFSYNDPDKWQQFNETLTKSKDENQVDPSIVNYFQALFKYTSKEQVEYLEAVRENTTEMHTKLNTAFDSLQLGGAIQITPNSDEGTCYVSLRYDEFLAKIFGHDLNYDKAHEFNVDVLEKGIVKLMQQTGLPVAMRFSFGFPVSNLGETGQEIRFTIGLEGAEQLQKYADIIAYLNGSLAAMGNEASTALKLKEPKEREKLLGTITAGIDSMEKLRVKLEPLLKRD